MDILSHLKSIVSTPSPKYPLGAWVEYIWYWSSEDKEGDKDSGKIVNISWCGKGFVYSICNPIAADHEAWAATESNILGFTPEAEAEKLEESRNLYLSSRRKREACN